MCVSPPTAARRGRAATASPRARRSRRPRSPATSSTRPGGHPPRLHGQTHGLPAAGPERRVSLSLSLSSLLDQIKGRVASVFHLLKKARFFFTKIFFICFIAIFQSPKWGERKVFQEFSRRALLSASLFLERRYFIEHAHENGTSLKEHKTEAERSLQTNASLCDRGRRGGRGRCGRERRARILSSLTGGKPGEIWRKKILENFLAAKEHKTL